jgi:hypothetical protein
MAMSTLHVIKGRHFTRGLAEKLQQNSPGGENCCRMNEAGRLLPFVQRSDIFFESK